MKDYKRLTKWSDLGTLHVIDFNGNEIPLCDVSPIDSDILASRFAELEDKIESGELCDRKETARDIVEMLKVAKGVVKVHFEAYDELVENIAEKYGIDWEDEE